MRPTPTRAPIVIPAMAPPESPAPLDPAVGAAELVVEGAGDPVKMGGREVAVGKSTSAHLFWALEL